MADAPPSLILLLGATGRVGRLAADRLLERGLRVRVMVRDPAAAALPPQVEVIAGDLRSADDIAAAVRDVDAVLFTAAATNLGGVVPQEVDFQGVARTADAARAAGARLMILLSSAAVTQGEHPHNCTFRSILKWKLRGEDHLRASGLPYVVVRALGLRDRAGGEQGVRILQGDRIAFGEDIARADVAAFLADLTVALVGPTGAAAPAGFAADFDIASMLGATCEIYNTRTLAPGAYASAQRRLTPDASPSPREPLP